MLASSSGASTSSSTQKGLGRIVEDREEQGESGERPLAARHQRHRLQALAAGLGHQLHAGVERVSALLGLHQS